MKARIDQYQVITGGVEEPTLSIASYPTAPDGVSLTETLAMIQSVHTLLRVVIKPFWGGTTPSPITWMH